MGDPQFLNFYPFIPVEVIHYVTTTRIDAQRERDSGIFVVHIFRENIRH